jgi:O-antigen/teichoic acid export membrane protein
MTGTTIAQAIPIAVTPILTRIYTPDEFGVYALFLAITAIFGAIATAQYEQAVILPKKDSEAIHLVILGIIISLLLSLLLFIVVLFFHKTFAELLGNNEIENWLYFIPLSSLLIGVYNSLNYFNIRKKKYKNVSISMVTKSTGLASIQTGLGVVLKQGSTGLIVGQMASYFFGNTILYKTFKQTKKKQKVLITKPKLKALLKLYKKFPLFSLPSILLNTSTINLINLLISTFFSITTLGFYSLTQRIIGIPSRIIGSSMSQVYFQQATLSYQQTGSTEFIFLKTLTKLTVISIPIFVILFIVAEPVFSFILGQKWLISGTYASILVPLAGFRFISSALSNTISIHQKQQFGLYINLILLITAVLIFYFCNYYKLEFITTLKLYSFVLSIEYIVFLVLYWRISKGER